MTAFPRPIHAGFTLDRAQRAIISKLATILKLSTIVLLAITAASCGHRTTRATRATVPPAPARMGSTEDGVASWYGVPYHGRRAASGEIYDMEQLTAAHRTLPFQTWVEVTNLDNGKRVDVRVTDRGPFVRGRIIDLSQAAARDIEMLRSGTARVQLKVIPPPVSPASTRPTALPAPATPSQRESFVVQAGAFADSTRADSLRAQLEEEFGDARIFLGPRNLWRVVVGRQMTMEQATELSSSVRQHGGEAQVVPEPTPE